MGSSARKAASQRGVLNRQIADFQIGGIRQATEARISAVGQVFETLDEFRTTIDEETAGGRAGLDLFFNTLGIASKTQQEQGITDAQAADIGVERFESGGRRQLLDEQIARDQKAFERVAAAGGFQQSGRFAEGIQDIGRSRANEAFSLFQNQLLAGSLPLQQQRIGSLENLSQRRTDAITSQGDIRAEEALGVGRAEADLRARALEEFQFLGQNASATVRGRRQGAFSEGAGLF